MKAAAFSGDYCDLKFVKTRKVAQITIEIPIEQAAASPGDALELKKVMEDRIAKASAA